MINVRHKSWDRLCDLIAQIRDAHGWYIYDHRCGKSWDPGQAVCAEEFGPDWNDNPEFISENQLSDSTPVKQRTIDAAMRVLAGCDWMKGEDE